MKYSIESLLTLASLRDRAAFLAVIESCTKTLSSIITDSIEDDFCEELFGIMLLIRRICSVGSKGPVVEMIAYGWEVCTKCFISL